MPILYETPEISVQELSWKVTVEESGSDRRIVHRWRRNEEATWHSGDEWKGAFPSDADVLALFHKNEIKAALG